MSCDVSPCPPEPAASPPAVQHNRGLKMLILTFMIYHMNISHECRMQMILPIICQLLYQCSKFHTKSGCSAACEMTLSRSRSRYCHSILAVELAAPHSLLIGWLVYSGIFWYILVHSGILHHMIHIWCLKKVYHYWYVIHYVCIYICTYSIISRQ